MDVWDAIRHKRAVRHFRAEPLPEEVVRRILDAGRRAQSAKNSQPWDFIAIRERATLEALARTGEWMGHVAGAALCVAIVTPAPDDNPRYPWHMFDAGQAAAYMQLAALELGIGSCPGTIYDEATARALLGVPADRAVRLVLSFGYPAEDAPRRGLGARGRRSFEEVVHWEHW
ncbi:MAG: nitroreductase family protein [Anaerolineae bacterium]